MKLAEGVDMKIKQISSNNPRVTAELKERKPSEPFVIAVSPKDTLQDESAELKVETDFPPHAPKSYSIFVRIR